MAVREFDGELDAEPVVREFTGVLDGEEKAGRSFGQIASDAGVSLLKGAIGLPESIVGLADIPTGGRVGKALESVGYKPGEAKTIVDGWYSDQQKSANSAVQSAEGFGETLAAVAQNPSTIATTALESVPSMLGGAGVARGVLKLAPKIAPVIAGAMGEGVVGAGSAAAQARSESKDGLLTAKQSAAAVGSGLGTGLIGFAGGKLAQRLGIADVDTLLASGQGQAVTKGFARQVIAAGISEGAFEEMPQSAQEQMWSNFSSGKPISDGVGNASAVGLISGASMGMAGGAGNSFMSKPAAPAAVTQPAPAETPTDLSGPAQDQPVSEVPAPTQSASRATPPAAPDESMQFADLAGDESPTAGPELGPHVDATPPAAADESMQLFDPANDEAPPSSVPAMTDSAQAVNEPAAVDAVRQAYGDNPVFVDLIQSNGAGLGLGSLGETLTRVAPKVAAAKAIIAAQRARTGQAAIDSALAEVQAAEQVAPAQVQADAGAQLSPLQADIAKIKARQAAPAPAIASFQAEDIQQLADPAPMAQAAPARTAATAAKVLPNQRRDDLVGAIMRVTGGRGISPGMAMTLTGDTANNATKLRGLFTSQGQQDMDDLAMMLREEEGYDVADGNALSEMVREAAAGNVTKSMERQAQDKAGAEEKQHRSIVRAQAKKLGIKTVAVEFSKIELEVFAAKSRRHEAAVALLDERSQKRFNEMLEKAQSVLDEDSIESVMMDAQARGLKAIAFWNETTKQLRAMVLDAQLERQNAAIENATEGADPYAEEVSNGRGNQPVGSGPDAARRDQAPAPTFELGQQTDAEIAAKLARENDAKTADRARIKAESEAGAGSFNLEAPQKPAAMVEAENKAKTGDMFAAPPPATSLQKDIAKIKEARSAPAKPVPLSSITIQVKATVAETGESVRIPEKADAALADVDSRLETMRGLLKCLAS